MFIDSKKKKDESINLGSLEFYFDAQEKDRLDHGVLGRRTGQVLALREKLLSLPEGEFDMAIKTIEKLVADVPRRPIVEKKQITENQRQARRLYEKVEQASNSNTASAEQIQKI